MNVNECEWMWMNVNNFEEILINVHNFKCQQMSIIANNVNK